MSKSEQQRIKSKNKRSTFVALLYREPVVVRFRQVSIEGMDLRDAKRTQVAVSSGCRVLTLQGKDIEEIPYRIEVVQSTMNKGWHHETYIRPWL